MVKNIKTLIIEILADNGAGHYQEIHLKVESVRPHTPVHTIRARLSEMSRSNNLEHRLNAYGDGFYGLYNENPNFVSVVSYPDRGPWGDSSYRGNCTGHIVKDLILRFKPQSVFDPAEGGGTVRDVVNGINQYLKYKIQYDGQDLKKGFNLLKSELPPKQYDFAFYHPPYWDIIRYSDNHHDLSNADSLEDFEKKLNVSAERLMTVVKPGGTMAILIGDKRKVGSYFPLMRSLLFNPKIGQLKSIIIKIQHNCVSDRRSYKSNDPFFIPIKHEYCLLFQKTHV